MCNSPTRLAAPLPPIFALFGQLCTDLGKAKYMLEINWAPLVGALAVRKEVLEKVPQKVREKIIQVAVEVGKTIRANGRAEKERAVDAMLKRGLVVNKLIPEREREWRVAAEKVYPMIRGSMMPGEVFDEAMRFLQEYRQTGGK